MRCALVADPRGVEATVAAVMAEEATGQAVRLVKTPVGEASVAERAAEGKAPAEMAEVVIGRKCDTSSGSLARWEGPSLDLSS